MVELFSSDNNRLELRERWFGGIYGRPKHILSSTEEINPYMRALCQLVEFATDLSMVGSAGQFRRTGERTNLSA
jgi:hypothetical protein